MQLGRNVDELIRLFQGLKVIDPHKVSVPVNWKPGEPVVVPVPGTVAEAAERVEGGEDGLTVKAWYLSTKELQE
jgi:peroxiredoxin 2/4